MNPSPQPVEPGVYLLQINNHLEDHCSAWFHGLSVARQGDGTTSLTGPEPDQTAQYGLLARVWDLGHLLVSVERIEPSGQSGPPGAAWDH